MCDVQEFSKVLDGSDEIKSLYVVLIICDNFPQCPAGIKALGIIVTGDRLVLNLSKPPEIVS